MPVVSISFFNREHSSQLQFLKAVIIGVLVSSAVLVPIIVLRSKTQSSTVASTATTMATTANGTTATIAATTTKLTRQFLNYTNITRPNDTIVGIFNTRAGSSSSWMVGLYSTSENPPKVIDNDINTKYLNFGDNLGLGDVYGINSGFYLTASVGSSVATGIRFTTANDAPERDPTMITLEGSNNATSDLPSSRSWTLIYSGPSGISATTDPGRKITCQLRALNNSIAYQSYRLLVTDKRGPGNSVQYAEFDILGYVWEHPFSCNDHIQSVGGIVISDWIFFLVSVGVPSEYKLREWSFHRW